MSALCEEHVNNKKSSYWDLEAKLLIVLHEEFRFVSSCTVYTRYHLRIFQHLPHQNKYLQNFYLISKYVSKQDIKNWLRTIMDNLKMKRIRTKFYLPERGTFEHQIFGNLCALDLNLKVTKSNLGNLLKEIRLWESAYILSINPGYDAEVAEKFLNGI